MIVLGFGVRPNPLSPFPRPHPLTPSPSPRRGGTAARSPSAGRPPGFPRFLVATCGTVMSATHRPGAMLGHAILPTRRRGDQLMGMAQASTTWTGERVRALPDDGLRYELVDGELLVTPSPGWSPPNCGRRLVSPARRICRSNSLGWVRFAPADISLGEDEVLQPDLFVIPAALNPRSWQEVRALLLVIEVLSPGTARYDRLVKRRRYQRAPVPEYWIVDLDARLVERWKPDDTRPEILHRHARVDARPGAQTARDRASWFLCGGVGGRIIGGEEKGKGKRGKGNRVVIPSGARGPKWRTSRRRTVWACTRPSLCSYFGHCEPPTGGEAISPSVPATTLPAK